jgi:hypothetical protein
MAEQDNGQNPPKLSRFKRWFGEFDPLRVTGGTILGLLVVVAAGFAVTFFSAAQFQSRVGELSLNGAPLTIWRVDKFRGEFQRSSQQIFSLREEVTELRFKKARQASSLALLKAEQAASDTSLFSGMLSLRARMMAGDPAAPVGGATPGSLHDAMTDIEQQLERMPLDRRQQFADEAQSLRASYQNWNDRLANIGSVTAAIGGYDSQIETFERQIKETAGSAAKLFGATTNDVAPEVTERIISITAELDALHGIWRSWIYGVALWTTDMVVLLLLISMGVLGSSLNLLAVFLVRDNEAMSFGEYPLRLAYGAVTAIVMFIIAKAGIPILADASKLGSSAPLNPYFISLLAVISGLMSDRAMDSIRSIATSILQTVGGSDFSRRYARLSIDDATKDTGRTLAGMSRTLGQSEDDTTKLFSGTDTVSPNQQKLISAYLDRPIRELFSDLPAS